MLRQSIKRRSEAARAAGRQDGQWTRSGEDSQEGAAELSADLAEAYELEALLRRDGENSARGKKAGEEEMVLPPIRKDSQPSPNHSPKRAGRLADAGNDPLAGSRENIPSSSLEEEQARSLLVADSHRENAEVQHINSLIRLHHETLSQFDDEDARNAPGRPLLAGSGAVAGLIEMSGG